MAVDLLDLFTGLLISKWYKKRKEKELEKELKKTFAGLPDKTIKLIINKIHSEVDKKVKEKKKTFKW